VDQRVRAKNAYYRKRLLGLNADLGALDWRIKDLFLYRYADYVRLPNSVNRNFLVQGHKVVVDLLESRGMTHSLAFIAWLTEDCKVQK